MPREPAVPRLTFTPRAWLKWQYLCHAGPTEIGAFGLSAEEDPLMVEDLIVVEQQTTPLSVQFDDTAVADLFDSMADLGIPPQRFARLWLHTHPGADVTPSGTDEETFQRVFGHCDWAVMAILGRTGRVSARLRFAAGPGGALALPFIVDWSVWPDMAHELDREITRWQREFTTLVQPEPFFLTNRFPAITATRQSLEEECRDHVGELSKLFTPDPRDLFNDREES